MKKADLEWFLRQASLAKDYIYGNKDREKYMKLMAQARRELKPKKKKE